jgi:hypothetical protein
MQTLQIDKNNARKLYPTASSEFKQMLNDTFGEQFFKVKITERVQTFDDILAIEGITFANLVNENDTPDEVAYKQAKLIAKVYNEGTVLNPNDKTQWKYYPWFEITPGSGVGLSYYVNDYWHSGTFVGVRLCFKSAELAKDAGQKFPDIYAALLIK